MELTRPTTAAALRAAVCGMSHSEGGGGCCTSPPWSAAEDDEKDDFSSLSAPRGGRRVCLPAAGGGADAVVGCPAASTSSSATSRRRLRPWQRTLHCWPKDKTLTGVVALPARAAAMLELLPRGGKARLSCPKQKNAQVAPLTPSWPPTSCASAAAAAEEDRAGWCRLSECRELLPISPSAAGSCEEVAREVTAPVTHWWLFTRKAPKHFSCGSSAMVVLLLPFSCCCCGNWTMEAPTHVCISPMPVAG
mmetsp:Transcript_61251/g.145811  ORF Transcript_61251/g.145811 Transcript_61251/m.145811 type:complete len:249 (+) Transcript_61251:506-1252(+)